MRFAASCLLLLCPCASPPTDRFTGSPAAELCVHPAANVGLRMRVPVAFELADFRWGLSTALQCFRLAAGGSEACCNAYRTGFRLPCGDDFRHGARTIEMTPTPTLNLAPTGFGPYRPAALGSKDGGTTTLGCLGCEAGLACSPAEPLRVRAVWGALNGGSFVVDALEME